MRPPDLTPTLNLQAALETAPLAARMRPRTLDEYVGQQHILGPGRVLRRAIEADRLFSSIILWGPPGTGKTSLATIVARRTQSHFASISAVLAGVADIRKVIADARTRRAAGQRTILLVDEIHRFNKAQQDALLPHVEDGTIILIGATTENPYFEVIGPLVSRSRVFRLQTLTAEDIRGLLARALQHPERGYGGRDLQVDLDALDFLSDMCAGDARKALNGLELAVESTPADEGGRQHVTLDVMSQAMQRRSLRYDKGGDEHYDTISAFIKSVRGSDPDAALYYLAKMVLAGEDPEFIMRRLLILAGEDIGMANPHGITVAAACAQALQYVGLPEAKFHLALATVYLATSPKSNTMTQYFKAEDWIQNQGDAPVPMHLRDTHYRAARLLGHKGYVYPHDFPGHHVVQQYLPDALLGQTFYQPSGEGYERTVAERLARWRETGS